MHAKHDSCTQRHVAAIVTTTSAAAAAEEAEARQAAAAAVGIDANHDYIARRIASEWTEVFPKQESLIIASSSSFFLRRSFHSRAFLAFLTFNEICTRRLFLQIIARKHRQPCVAELNGGLTAAAAVLETTAASSSAQHSRPAAGRVDVLSGTESSFHLRWYLKQNPT